jgi:hypothetical protein
MMGGVRFFSLKNSCACISCVDAWERPFLSANTRFILSVAAFTHSLPSTLNNPSRLLPNCVMENFDSFAEEDKNP